MTIAAGFAPLLLMLASQTAADAKAGAADELKFDTQGKPDGVPYPGFFALESDIGTDVESRVCCTFQTDNGVDVAQFEVTPHEYRKKSPANSWFSGGGVTGYVYTRRGGFIDLGHTRDYIDYARFFANKIMYSPRDGRSGDAAQFAFDGGKIRLVIAPRTEIPSRILAAVMGARLAYERATWHEVCTYFNAEKISSYSPEDCFSNALGALVGFRALLTPREPFDKAADAELKKALEDLGHVSKPVTDDAMDYVKGHWWNLISLKRRNFDPVFTPVPWLVSDILVPDKDAQLRNLREKLGRPSPARISIPSHYNGQLLSDVAYLEIVDVDPGVTALMTLPHPGPLRSTDFPTLVTQLQAKCRVDDGANADKPGNPAP